MEHYRLFQKRIASHFPLGEFREKRKAKVDIHVRPLKQRPRESSLRWYHHVSDNNRVRFSSFALTGKSYFIRMYGTADFLVDAKGRWIECRLTGAEKNMIAQLLSFVIPFAITLSGAQVLHASAVRLRKGVVAFMGTQGLGKSTLAAAFYGGKFTVLTDDAMPLRESRGRFFAIPSFPEIRLSKPTTLTLLGKKSVQGLERAFRKKRVKIQDRFADREAPLRTIYVLERAASPRAKIRIEPVPPREAWLFLLNNSYRIDPEDRTRMREEALLLLALAKRIPMKRLVYPRTLHTLPRLMARILADQRI